MTNVAHATSNGPASHALNRQNQWRPEHECSGADHGNPPSSEIRRQVAWAMLIERQRDLGVEEDFASYAEELRECLSIMMTLSLEVETMESDLAYAREELAALKRSRAEELNDGLDQAAQ